MPEETTSPELQELTELLRRRGDRLPEQRKPNIVVCGQTGVGKTTTVNTLFGREVGAVGDYSRGSVTDELHEWEAHGQYIDIVDLPGPGPPERDRAYREMDRRRIPEADGFLVVVTPPRPFNSATKSTVDLLIACGVEPEKIVFAYNRLGSLTTRTNGERRSVTLNGIAGPVSEADREAVELARRAFHEDLREEIHGGRYRERFSLDQIVPYDALHGWNIFALFTQVLRHLPGEALANWHNAVSRGIRELQERAREQILAEKEELLHDWEEFLTKQEKAITQRERKLARREKALSRREKEIDEREKAFAAQRRTDSANRWERRPVGQLEDAGPPKRFTPSPLPAPNTPDDTADTRRKLQERTERIRERQEGVDRLAADVAEHETQTKRRFRDWLSDTLKQGAELVGRFVHGLWQASVGG